MPIYCQDCGIMIYYDDDMKEPVECVDDMSRPPYITASGDLFCVWCGERYDESEEDNCGVALFGLVGVVVFVC